MKRIYLFCKGPSLKNINLNEIKDNDRIAWANVHNMNNGVINLPKRIDYFFLRNKNFIEDLDPKEKEIISKIDIKNILTAGVPAETILNKKVLENLSHKEPFGFDASTGLIALNYLINLNPKELIVGGFDLFKTGESYYYFDNKKNLTSNKTLRDQKKKKYVKNNIIINDIKVHPKNETLDYLTKVIEKNSDINFTFYTISEELKNNLKKYKNVTIR